MMFKDDKEANFFNCIAKAVAETIAMQLDEVDEVDGDVDFSQITLNVSKRCITVNTDYIDAGGRRYTVHDEVRMFKAKTEFLPKVYYMFLRDYADDFEHGVNFSGWFSPRN